jgi:hypothetical protein
LLDRGAVVTHPAADLGEVSVVAVYAQAPETLRAPAGHADDRVLRIAVDGLAAAAAPGRKVADRELPESALYNPIGLFAFTRPLLTFPLARVTLPALIVEVVLPLPSLAGASAAARAGARGEGFWGVV